MCRDGNGDGGCLGQGIDEVREEKGERVGDGTVVMDHTQVLG